MQGHCVASDGLFLAGTTALTGKVTAFLEDSALEVSDEIHHEAVEVNDTLGYTAVIAMLDDAVNRATDQGV